MVDINFGCPARKSVAGSGLGLLNDIEQIQRIVDAVASAVDVPVSMKTRIGLTLDDSAGTDVAIAQNAGAQLIVMHGRSRACRFKGQAQPHRLREARQHIDVPLLVNGDVIDSLSASRAVSASGADGVMIGRGAMGQPWIFAQLLGQPMPEFAERLDVIGRHLQMMHEFYGDEAGARIARKHMQAYLQRWGAAELTSSFMALTDGSAQNQWLYAHHEMLLGIAQSAATKVGAQIPVAA